MPTRPTTRGHADASTTSAYLPMAFSEDMPAVQGSGDKPHVGKVRVTLHTSRV